MIGEQPEGFAMTLPVLASICVLNSPRGHTREAIEDAAADVIGFAFSVTSDKPLDQAGSIRADVAKAVSKAVDSALRVEKVGYSITHRPEREVMRRKIDAAIKAHKAPMPDYFAQ